MMGDDEMNGLDWRGGRYCDRPGGGGGGVLFFALSLFALRLAGWDWFGGPGLSRLARPPSVSSCWVDESCCWR